MLRLIDSSGTILIIFWKYNAATMAYILRRKKQKPGGGGGGESTFIV